MDEKKSESGNTSVLEAPVSEQDSLHRWLAKLHVTAGLETRGIERVPEEYRHPKVTVASYMQMFLVWFAINCSANNITLGILGPVTYGLGFNDAVMSVLISSLTFPCP